MSERNETRDAASVQEMVATIRRGGSRLVKYRLAVLTHGRMSTLDATLDSFAENVTPAPVETLIYADGGYEGSREILRHYRFAAGIRVDGTDAARGFCAATRALWEWASEPGADYVFWLEHDFLFLRPVDLTALAAVLLSDDSLAQMALCRGPANRDEQLAGGLVASQPDAFHPRDGWLSHAAYFSTNPSLMRRSFMVNNPWPAYGEECEGRFGFDLRERGYSFGLWGDGSEWVQHIGVRSGFGY